MKRLNLLILTLTGLLIFSGGAQAQQANYSACGCTPRSQDAFHNFGAGANGFFWDTDIGAWLNLDNETNEILSCPIPYDHLLLTSLKTPRPVRVVVNVIDNHNREEVFVELMGQTATGEAISLGNAHTADSFVGSASLTIDAFPLGSIRYLWLRVNVPDEQPGGRSGVRGYQVSRPRS
jgi:hypothetical protein